MVHCTRSFFNSFAVLALFSSFALAHENKHELPIEESVEVRNRGTYETCIDMHEGQALYYNYTASRAVDFDIHYHDGEEVMYLAQERTDALEGSVEIPASTEICFYWQNKSFADPASIQYKAAAESGI